jgi:MYXO-CTERM domain-containing protein
VDDFEQAFPVTALTFPLPVLETEVESYDFGEVLVGSVANLELPISNGGQLDLEGTVGHLGSPWFSSYPEYFLAGPGREDGVVVTFSPEGEGPVSATLLLESNDPLVPIREIELTGVGLLPEEESGVEGGGGVQEEGGTSDGVSEETKVGGCGCSSAPQNWSGGLGALMALGLLRRRRT